MNFNDPFGYAFLHSPHLEIKGITAYNFRDSNHFLGVVVVAAWVINDEDEDEQEKYWEAYIGSIRLYQEDEERNIAKRIKHVAKFGSPLNKAQALAHFPDLSEETNMNPITVQRLNPDNDELDEFEEIP